MSDSLEFTGERFTPECVREIWYEHFHRYVLAARWCKNTHTLDAACGEGYGSALLNECGATVRGVDISEQAITHARQRYGSRPGIEFDVADCTRLPFEDNEFDRVVSFETLEHMEAHDELLAEFRRVLKPDGFLILSSPDKAIYSEQQDSENEFHVKELYRHELEELIQRTPGAEGSWFATAKKLGVLPMALKLVYCNPCDPKTLNRAVRGFIDDKDPPLALGVAKAPALSVTPLSAGPF